MTDLSNMRRDYAGVGLTKKAAGNDPLLLFQRWFTVALEANIPDPTAMTLATATAEGRPSARTVLLKDVGSDGFAFYTNYRSRKGRELEENPCAALLFWWQPLDRQVRIEGPVEKLEKKASDAYFRLRPRESQISACASQQSEVVESREALERLCEEARVQYGETDVPRPEHWGGYLLQPTAIEFWQGRPNRLHDRLRYTREENGWKIERLAP